MNDREAAKQKCRLWMKEKEKENKDSNEEKEFDSDVLGSYTGIAQDPCEEPEQDADDL